MSGTLKLLRAVVAACMAVTVAACGSERVTYDLVGSTMGTTFSIRVVGSPDALEADALKHDVLELLSGIEQSMSTYIPGSELSKFNAYTGSDWFGVSASLCRVVAGARRISELTGGAFDVTIGPLVDAWGFGPGRTLSQPPEPERIAELRKRIGHGRVHTDCSRPALRKDAAEIHVDLSGYAKGHAVDRIAALLDQYGLGDYLVEIGGEVRAKGMNARDSAWAIAIERPQRDSRSVARIVSLSDAAMATSGDYRNYFESAGRFYSHTIDPRTGYPISHDLAAVTVVAETAAFADGMATALLVLGPAEGLELAERENIAAFFQSRANGAVDERMSPRFAREVMSK